MNKDGWIPCDEKLPKPNELVDNVRKYYLIQDEYGDMCVARYTKKRLASDRVSVLFRRCCSMDTVTKRI